MRFCWILLLGACQAIPVTVGASAEAGGTRVFFRREHDSGNEEPPRIYANGGRLTEVVYSADRSTVSALWSGSGSGGEGSVECRFPGGGRGTFQGTAPRDRALEYVFLDVPGVSATASIPRDCPLRPAVTLRLRLAPGLLPATIHFPGGKAKKITRPDTKLAYAFRRTRGGELVAGDYRITVEVGPGEAFAFVIAIDRDGVPAAVSGYVRNWDAALD